MTFQQVLENTEDERGTGDKNPLSCEEIIMALTASTAIQRQDYALKERQHKLRGCRSS